jgi:cation diffusion facilitator family transporter
MKTKAHQPGKMRHLREQALRLAGLTLAVDAIMALFKVSVGVLTGSQALVVNSLYSINDVLSSIAVTVSLRVGQKRPSTDYQYGYGRAEFIAVAMVSLAITLGVLLLFVFSTTDILKGVVAPPHYIAALLAAVSLVVSWVIAHKNHHVAEQLRSPALATSAEHHHADYHGSLLTLVGIAGSALLGFHVLDRIIATFEELHLIALSGTLLARAVNGLMDRGLPEEDRLMVERACGDVAGVSAVKSVRSRQLGSLTWVDVAVAVAPRMTIAEASLIRNNVTNAVRGVVGSGQLITQVRFQAPHTVVLGPGPGAAGLRA